MYINFLPTAICIHVGRHVDATNCATPRGRRAMKDADDGIVCSSRYIAHNLLLINGCSRSIICSLSIGEWRYRDTYHNTLCGSFTELGRLGKR